MKRILVLGISAVLALPVMSVGAVWALSSNSGPSGGSQQTNKTEDNSAVVATETQTATEQPTGTDDAASLQVRLAQRKTELKIKLSALEKLNIQNKCKASQGLVSSINGRIKGIETSRTEVYGNITTKLNDLSAKLKNKGADTKDLDADIAALQTKMTTFTTDLTAYKQAMSDLAAMDCKTDPDGFKASLLTARTALDTVKNDAGAVRSYLDGTIKPELVKIRASLDSTKTGDNQ